MKKDEWEDYDMDDYEEEDEKINPWVAIGIFVGMIILAAMICAILWNVTHKDKPQENNVNATEAVQDISAEETTEDTEEIPEESLEETLEDDAPLETEAGVVEESNHVISEVPETVNDDVQNSTPVAESQDMAFVEVAETVTAKDVINLRSEPSTVDDENIVAQLRNGETISRTGINEDTGWSRLDYNGQTVYGVSGYLTTDLSYETPVKQSNSNSITTQDGRVITFTDCDDYVRPKHYVNLRTEPSTSQGESTVKCQITYADIVHRTGYSEDSGWSRVEFYGDVLYVVTSYMLSAE